MELMAYLNQTALAGDSHLDLAQEIERLKHERRAVILAHFYQNSEIQDLADHVEDSLGLARLAQSTDAEVIVFAGVHFMAETAKILNPRKTVVVPDLAAGCSLADGCPPEEFAKFRMHHLNHFVVSYINCSAEIKAMSDVICTSTNAAQIISHIPENRPILFAPDKNLCRYLMKETGRDMVAWDGSCMVHDIFSERRILQLKMKHPQAKIIAHPECEEKILRHADFIGSTSKLLKYVEEDATDQFIVVTESGILHQMEKKVPHKTLIAGPPEDSSCACNECPHMRLNTLEKLYYCLRDLQPELTMSEDLRVAALKPLQRMLKWSQ